MPIYRAASGPASVTASSISDSTAVGRTVLTAADAAAARVSLGVPPGPMMPASDQWLNPTFVSGYTTGTPSSGTLYLAATDIGPDALSAKGLGCNVATAAVPGAATITVSLALYRDNGTGGAPDFTQMVGSVTVDPTSTGVKYGVLGSPVSLSPGRYWTGCLYYHTTTPTTTPQFTCISSVIGVPFAAATAPGTATKAHIVTGRTTLPTTAQTIGNTAGFGAPAVAIRAN